MVAAVAAFAVLPVPAAVAGGDVRRRGGGSAARTAPEEATWGEVAAPAGLSLRLEAAPAAIRAVLGNDGPEPVTLAVDPRLVDLDVRVGRLRVRCSSPDPLRPPDLGGAEVRTIPPGGSAAVEVDLLYHCWRDLDRLRRGAGEAGAAVFTARYGLVLVDAASGQPIGRAGRLEATAELPVPATGETAAGGSEARGEGETFTVEADGHDAVDGSAVWLHVTVRNVGGAAVRLVDHPTQFRFEVTGPTGTWACSMRAWRIVPLADLLVRLRRGGRYVQRVELSRYCPQETFARPGIYWIVPIYDPYLADAAPEPVFDRPVRGAPAAVRVRRGRGG